MDDLFAPDPDSDSPTEEETPEGTPDLSAPPSVPHLDTKDPSTWQKPDGLSWGDFKIKAGRPLSARQKEAARLIFLGKSNKEVAHTVGYTEAWLSQLKTYAGFRDEVERLREAAFQKTVTERLKDLSPLALDAVEGAMSEQSDLKLREKVELAKWLIEKVDGKASQKVETEDTTLSKFLDLLKEARLPQVPQVEQKPLHSVLDLNPAPASVKQGESMGGESDAERWVLENL